MMGSLIFGIILLVISLAITLSVWIDVELQGLKLRKKGEKRRSSDG